MVFNELCQKRLRLKAYVQSTETLNIVLGERRKEFLFTGMRWMDQGRLVHLGEYNKTITRSYDDMTVSLEPTSPNYVLLIPSQILKFNPDLEQNPR